MGKHKHLVDERYWKGKPHHRVRAEVIDSPAWRTLSYPAKALYQDLRRKMNSHNNGNIECTLADMKHKGWRSSATLSAALRELEHMGFIAKTRQGGIAAMSKLCSLYRFTDIPVLEFPKQGITATPETFDYRRFDSVKAAQAHKAELRAKKLKVQDLKLIGSESEAMKTLIGSESEQERERKVQKMNKAKEAVARAVARV